MIVSADTQIGFLRDFLEEAAADLAEACDEHDIPASADAAMVFDIFTAILRTVTAARALYEHRADGDPQWLSDLFHAVAPVSPPGDGA